MNITGVGARSSLIVQSLGAMRTQLDDLQRQLGTGQKSTNYAGLGSGSGLSVSLRSQLTAMSNYADGVTNIGVRVSLQQSALTRFSELQRTVKAETQGAFDADANGKTTTQRAAAAQLDEMLGLLNSKAGDRYLFSGRALGTPATETSDRIMNGDLTHAGFLKVVDERGQADGVGGLGRLTLSAITSSAATLIGVGATLTADAAATVAGTQDLSVPYTSAGGTLSINGTNVTIGAGADITAILAAINAPAVVAATGVTATAPGGLLTLTQADDDASIDLTGTTGSLITEFGIAVGPTDPNNLLTQGAVTAGQQLTIKVGSNPTLTVTFGTNEVAVPPEVSTLAELNALLGTLAGGTASVNLTDGNIQITASNTTDAITLGGNATPANFGLAATSATPSNLVGLAEDLPTHPFGFKLTAITTTVTGAAVTGPAGSPAAMSVDFHAQPSVGQKVSIVFTLPDGSSETLALTATTATPPRADEFTIGGTLAATTANFQAALNTSVGKLAGSSLAAASAIAAGHNFFDVDAGQPPLRVAGPPFNTATALVAGTSANTVTWYTGEMGTDSARGTAVARVDETLTVSYGVRGNEQGLRNTIQQVAVFAAMTYSSTDPNASARFAAVNQRLYVALDGTPGQQRIEDISTELAYAQTTMKSATDRQRERQATLQTLLQSVEQAPEEEVASTILALQTRLQAALQTTATLYRLSIINYL